ncbi:hypothetical protein GALMADRAFT_231669 [Galerina marginata CBS 339.88]|uniref:Uncharacterized protein n=1 Tax=Galerina marginata (strain CBS 339.88) TaxID=685588 RepID=A0A067SAT8_GALM3|nr:hypothetical protein GALMADRAFT_231669 [Galerina marginata CBS 339.88]
MHKLDWATRTSASASATAPIPSHSRVTSSQHRSTSTRPISQSVSQSVKSVSRRATAIVSRNDKTRKRKQSNPLAERAFKTVSGR